MGFKRISFFFVILPVQIRADANASQQCVCACVCACMSVCAFHTISYRTRAEQSVCGGKCFHAAERVFVRTHAVVCVVGKCLHELGKEKSHAAFMSNSQRSNSSHMFRVQSLSCFFIHSSTMSNRDVMKLSPGRGYPREGGEGAGEFKFRTRKCLDESSRTKGEVPPLLLLLVYASLNIWAGLPTHVLQLEPNRHADN